MNDDIPMIQSNELYLWESRCDEAQVIFYIRLRLKQKAEVMSSDIVRSNSP